MVRKLHFSNLSGTVSIDFKETPIDSSYLWPGGPTEYRLDMIGLKVEAVQNGQVFSFKGKVIPEIESGMCFDEGNNAIQIDLWWLFLHWLKSSRSLDTGAVISDWLEERGHSKLSQEVRNTFAGGS